VTETTTAAATARTPQIHGEVAPGFEGVRDAFVANFERYGEVGASVAVYQDGAPVVDLWGGTADPATGRPWTRSTSALVYSATKGATSICVNILAQQGKLDLDAPVAEYWPEFAAAGKDRVTVTQLLSHQAGLPVLDTTPGRAELLAGAPVVEALARQRPIWEPGTAHGYHALTFGWLVGELVRRISGRSLGRFLADEVAAPLGLDLWVGLPADRVDEVAPLIDAKPDPGVIERIADLRVREVAERVATAAKDPTSLLFRAATTNGSMPTPHAATWNDPAVQRAEIPAANLITNARSLARMYAACLGEVDGVRVLSEETVERACVEQVRGPDAVTIVETRFGLGFRLSNATVPMLGEGSFGHNGAGGATGFADQRSRIGFGYVQNQLAVAPAGDPRTAGLVTALRAALA
jgi:CubicO group peptidase (beta-lactamase class C family)